MKRVLHETRLWANRILPLREWGCKQICKSRQKMPAALAVASGEELTIPQSSGRRPLPFARSHSTCRWRRRTQSSVPTTHQRVTLVNKSPYLALVRELGGVAVVVNFSVLVCDAPSSAACFLKRLHCLCRICQVQLSSRPAEDVRVVGMVGPFRKCPSIRASSTAIPSVKNTQTRHFRIPSRRLDNALLLDWWRESKSSSASWALRNPS